MIYFPPAVERAAALWLREGLARGLARGSDLVQDVATADNLYLCDKWLREAERMGWIVRLKCVPTASQQFFGFGGTFKPAREPLAEAPAPWCTWEVIRYAERYSDLVTLPVTEFTKG